MYLEEFSMIGFPEWMSCGGERQSLLLNMVSWYRLPYEFYLSQEAFIAALLLSIVKSAFLSEWCILIKWPVTETYLLTLHLFACGKPHTK